MKKKYMVILFCCAMNSSLCAADTGIGNPFLSVSAITKTEPKKEMPKPAVPLPPLPMPAPAVMPQAPEGPARVSTWKILGRAGKSVIVTDTLSSSSSTASLVYSIPNGSLWDNCVVDYPVFDCSESRVKEHKEQHKKRMAPTISKQTKNGQTENVLEAATWSSGFEHAMQQDTAAPKTKQTIAVRKFEPVWYQAGTAQLYREKTVGEVEIKTIRQGVFGIKIKKDKQPHMDKILGTAMLTRDVVGDYAYYMATGVATTPKEIDGKKNRGGK